MKKLFISLIILVSTVNLFALTQTGNWTIPTQNIRGTFTLVDSTTATIIQAGGELTGSAVLSNKTGTITWSGPTVFLPDWQTSVTATTTGTLTISASDDSTGTISYDQIAGTFTLTTNTSVAAATDYCYYNVTKNMIRIDWKANAAGTQTVKVKGAKGIIQQVRYSSGATAPSESYDITLKDATGYDVLTSSGSNLTSATTTVKVPYVTINSVDYLIPVTDRMTFLVENAGDGGEGIVQIYLKEN